MHEGICFTVLSWFFVLYSLERLYFCCLIFLFFPLVFKLLFNFYSYYTLHLPIRGLLLTTQFLLSNAGINWKLLLILISRMSLKLKPAIFLLSLIGVGLIVLSAFSDCNGWLQSFAPTACFSDKNANVLFVRRLNRSMKPFLSAKTKLSEDDFNWWKVCWKKNKTLIINKGLHVSVQVLLQSWPKQHLCFPAHTDWTPWLCFL